MFSGSSALLLGSSGTPGRETDFLFRTTRVLTHSSSSGKSSNGLQTASGDGLPERIDEMALGIPPMVAHLEAAGPGGRLNLLQVAFERILDVDAFPGPQGEAPLQAAQRSRAGWGVPRGWALGQADKGLRQGVREVAAGRVGQIVRQDRTSCRKKGRFLPRTARWTLVPGRGPPSQRRGGPA